MRIIKQGALPEEQVFVGTCSHCKTVFECKRSEGIYYEDQREGVFLEVECPFCKTKAYAYKSNGGKLNRWDTRESNISSDLAHWY